MKTHAHRLVYHTRGGQLEVGELRLLAESAVARGDGRLYFLPRQTVLLRGLDLSEARKLIPPPHSVRLHSAHESAAPNIVTSACVSGLPGGRPWLTPGLFGDVLALFQARPGLSVSLADPVQAHVPAMSGRIAFLAAGQRDLWQVYLADAPGTLLPGAVRSNDIPAVSAMLEEELFARPTCDAESLRTMSTRIARWAIETTPLPLPPVRAYQPVPDALQFPSGLGGISAQFLVDLCVFAAGLGPLSLGVTPWATLLLRGLAEGDLQRVREWMLRARVAEDNIAWSNRVLCTATTPDHLGSACRIAADLAQRAPVDGGLAWALLAGEATMPDVHLSVRRRPGRFPRGPRFDVWIRQGLEGRRGEWMPVSVGIREREVAAAILGSVDRQISVPDLGTPAAEPTHVATVSGEARMACVECLTEYDVAIGDPFANISSGIPFEALPETWGCPVCGAPKECYTFVAIG